MSSYSNTRDQVKELTKKLERGIQDLFISEKYADYLKTMSRFHKYSYGNVLLIQTQNPNAVQVAGYEAWRTKFGRTVKRGEKGIRILAPAAYKETKEVQKLDPVTKVPLLDNAGLPVAEQVEVTIPYFRVVYVFDVSQTEGRPLPQLSEDLSGSVTRYDELLQTLRLVSPLPIAFEPLSPDTDGFCRYGDRIAIRTGMSETQTVSAILHEIAHAKLHNRETLRLRGDNAKPKDKQTMEVEAESVSYTVCQSLGIETAANSFGYIAGWSSGRELSELRASLDTIRATAAELIDGIEDRLREILKSRESERTVEPESITTLEREAGYDSIGEPAIGIEAPHTPSLPSADVDTLPKVADPDLLFPDPSLTVSEMNEYGYTQDNMYPLSIGKAVELFDANHTIYLLYPDNTEVMAFDRDEILAFDGKGFCGIAKEDWATSPVYKATLRTSANAADNRNEDLLSGTEGRFAIYQIPDGSENARNLRFASMRELKARGLTIDRANYEMVYSGKNDIIDTHVSLERIYADFQADSPWLPPDYRSRSVSVSDVIVLQKNGEVSAHYVDSTGFVELPVFFDDQPQRPQDPRIKGSGITDKIAEETRSKTQPLQQNRYTAAPRPSASILSRLAEKQRVVEQGKTKVEAQKNAQSVV